MNLHQTDAARLLKPGETIWWSGQPQALAYVWHWYSHYLYIVLLVAFFALIIFWRDDMDISNLEKVCYYLEITADEIQIHSRKAPEQGQFILIILAVMSAFLLLLAYVMARGILAPWLAYLRARRTYYAVSNQRALEIELGEKAVIRGQALPNTIGKIDRVPARGGTANLLFCEDWLWDSGSLGSGGVVDSAERATGFIAIGDADGAERWLRKLKAHTQQAE